MIRFLLRDLAGSLGSRPLQLLAASLFLGVLLVTACTALLALVRGGIAAEERSLFGGDVSIESREPLIDSELDWLRANAEVSRLVELRTMAGTTDGRFTVVELQSVDAAYPLYGDVRLDPPLPLAEATAGERIAIDPALASELDLDVGDRLLLGALELEVSAIITQQPDRALSADTRGPPVLVSEATLAASGLVTPTSRIEYEYRLRLDEEPSSDWITRWRAAFPAAPHEVRSVEQRGEFVTERLNEVASVLLLIALATLLIGGLGVANGVAAWLDAKRGSLATLASLGARSAWTARVVVGELTVIAILASGIAAALGAGIAWWVSRMLAAALPIASTPAALLIPALAAAAFGVLAALAFAAPALGRTLDTEPARLLRDGPLTTSLAPRWRRWSIGLAGLAAIALIVLTPDRLIGAGFVLALVVLFVALEGIVRGIRRVARALASDARLADRFATRLAIAGLDRTGSPLRPLFLSLGIASTLLVAAGVVIVALLSMLNGSVPERAPALVFYDIQDAELADFTATVTSQPSLDRLATVPLVLGRLQAVNGEPLAARGELEEALEANDEHKLGYRDAAIDATRPVQGSWWPADHDGAPVVAMEDREADQIGVSVGDRLVFSIQGEPLEAELVAIYAQGNFETRFWFEALFSPGALDPWITRHVGSAWFTDEAADDAALQASNAIGRAFPAVVTVRTERALASARRILGAAALAVALVAVTSLVASALVMASVVTANRRRQLAEAALLHALGTRRGTVLDAMKVEYGLLGVLLAVFATLVGGALGAAVAVGWLELPLGPATWAAAPAIAIGVAGACLGAGAWYVARALSASPATLLRVSG